MDDITLIFRRDMFGNLTNVDVVCTKPVTKADLVYYCEAFKNSVLTAKPQQSAPPPPSLKALTDD